MSTGTITAGLAGLNVGATGAPPPAAPAGSPAGGGEAAPVATAGAAGAAAAVPAAGAAGSTAAVQQKDSDMPDATARRGSKSPGAGLPAGRPGAGKANLKKKQRSKGTADSQIQILQLRLSIAREQALAANASAYRRSTGAAEHRKEPLPASQVAATAAAPPAPLTIPASSGYSVQLAEVRGQLHRPVSAHHAQQSQPLMMWALNQTTLRCWAEAVEVMAVEQGASVQQRITMGMLAGMYLASQGFHTPPSAPSAMHWA